MRPIKLSMTAFGPFIATETVDFEVFGERPLFLINGATGAGKTTILDAICFALYGQTTGKEREAVQMRCDYADDNTTTTVEFIFELAGQQYRIVRIPEQTRAKKSGEGTTTQKARAELWQVNGESETVLVPEKVTEATQKIEELTGLQVDQFRQVMVLPQGQFRRLLMADSKDREQIFSQLFETGIYKKIEDKLKQLASQVESKVRVLKNEQQGVLQTVGFDDVEALLNSITEIGPPCEAAKKLKKEKESDYLTAVKTVDAAKVLSQNFVQLQRLSIELKELEQHTSTIDIKEKRLKWVELAQKIKPVFTEKTRIQAELEIVSQQRDVAAKVLQQADETLKQATLNIAQVKTFEQEKDQLKQQGELLKSYRQRAARLQQTRAESIAAESTHTKSTAKLDTETMQLERLKQQLQQRESERKLLEQSLTKEAEVSGLVQRLEQMVSLRQRLDALLLKKASSETSFATITQSGKTAANHKEQKDKALKQQDLAWHSGQAAILARQLQQDHPCLVCGSLDHPMPAQATIDLPTDIQREAAHQELELAQVNLLKAREEYSKIKSDLEGLTPQISALHEQLGAFSEQSISQLKQLYDEQADELNKLQKSRQQLTIINQQMDESKRSLEIAEQYIKQSQAQCNESVMQLQTCKVQLESALKELPEQYRESGKLEVEIATIEASLTKLSQQIETAQQAHIEAGKHYSSTEANLETLKSRHDALASSAETAMQRWLQALEHSVFSTKDDFQQADLLVEEQERLSAEVTDFKKKLQTLQGAIQEREKILAGEKQPDLEVLQTALAVALDQKNQAEYAWQILDKKLNQLQAAKKSFDTLAVKQSAYEQEYKTIGTLSNVANGNTGNKISLQRFVLGVLLDDVLLAASSRLTLMSKGRYNLLRKEDRAKGNKASGLEMEVEDTYTGKLRAVSTLSGGESFLASLSLALGLSDVVQAYAGGIRLETLFIDEGFGSLDSDTLDLAIKTLIDLRNTGRMVGIISHVSELKEQITMRLDVISGRQGSKIQLVY